jgi:chromosome segregation ATPase
MLIRRHADTQTALENSLLLERRNTADLHQAYDDLKRTLNLKDKDIAEARQEAKKARSVMLESVVRLSGEQLRAQFPADVREAIADLNALVNELASARDGLNAEVLRLQAANRSLGEQRQSLQLELQQAHRERQQAMLVTHDLVDRDAAMHEEHAAERGALQAKVSVLEQEVLSLQADKAASLEREEAMRVQVDALSSDPISVNVRKYGIPRTKLLQEQMEAMHGRTVETTQALDDERRAAAELRGEVQRLQTALGAASSREAALTVSRDRLAGDKAEVERHKAAAEKVVADQEERLKRLASAIQEREEQVEASRIHAVSLQGMLEQRQGELAASTEQVGTLAGDNVRLLDQVSGLVRDLQDLEAQKRAQDAAIQQLMRSGAGRGGGHYQPHQRGTSSSARTHAAQQQQRRASPTAPTSLTRPVQQ